jgi:twitching motility protein PilT
MPDKVEKEQAVNLRDLLQEMIDKRASDLHITAGIPPMLRVDGIIRRTNHPVITPDVSRQIAYSIITEEQQKRFENEKELDFSFGVQGLSRFRANVFQQRGVTSVAIRQIPFEILDFKGLGLPAVVEDFSKKMKGLVLVTGPTGSGKSTTLASIIDKINNERQSHVITIEDPIEYIHQHKKCIVNQREVRADTDSFQSALKHVLRQDPDVILIGEMRDLETMQAALTIAETGHLALATLHTNSTFESINRIVSAESAVAGAGAARLRSRGGHHPAAHRAPVGQGAGPRGGGHGVHPRDQGVHPRRQGSPDLRAYAGRNEIRHADHESGSFPRIHEQADIAG